MIWKSIPFFPDGTWCHNDGKKDYYCLARTCQPAGKARNHRDNSKRPEVSIDYLNNARPKEIKTEQKLKEYFQYHKNKNPPKPKISDFAKPDEDDYIIDSISSN